jgi:hypothetical protein
LGSFGIIILLFEFIFVVFIIYFIKHEASKMRKEKLNYFKRFWNLNEFVIISFSLISMIMFVMRNMFTELAIKEVHSTELGEFVNFNTIASWNGTFSSMSAIVVFCSTLKFLKLLRFNKRIGMLSNTLKYASRDLISFSFVFAIFMVAFTQFGQIIFGSLLGSYKDFMSSLESLFRLALGQFNLKEMTNANFIFGSVFFIAFILIVVIGLMSMFITILNESFDKVKKDLTNEKDNEVIEYLFGSLWSHKQKTKNSENSLIKSNSEMEKSINGDESLRVTIRKKNEPDFLYTSNKSLQAPLAKFDDDSVSSVIRF